MVTYLILTVAELYISPLGISLVSKVCLLYTSEKYEATLKTPVKELPEDALDEVLYGSDERIKIKSSLIGTSSDYFVTFEGVIKYIQICLLYTSTGRLALRYPVQEGEDDGSLDGAEALCLFPVFTE